MKKAVLFTALALFISWNQMKYGEDDELITPTELYSAYPKLWLTDNEFPVAITTI